MILANESKRSIMKISIQLIISMFLISMCYSCGGRPYRFKNVLKTDIDLVADFHFEEVNNYLKTLMIKLYKRNPSELKKNSNETIDSRMKIIFQYENDLRFEELGNKQGIEAMLLTFEETYRGDRVFSLVAGLARMILKSYNDQREFYIIDTLDQQKLYNSARNIEILVWRLSNKKKSSGQLFLLTNESTGEVTNLSFERLFGKMISTQDMMARIVADKTNRTITFIVHRLATAAFLPVGF